MCVTVNSKRLNLKMLWRCVVDVILHIRVNTLGTVLSVKWGSTEISLFFSPGHAIWGNAGQIQESRSGHEFSYMFLLVCLVALHALNLHRSHLTIYHTFSGSRVSMLPAM